MKQEALSHFPTPMLIGIAFFLFFSVFLLLLFWTYRKGSSEIYEHTAQLPLDGEGK